MEVGLRRHPTTRKRGAAGFVLGLAVLGGCAVPPQITVRSVDVVAQGQNAVQVAIRMDMRNDSDEPVKLDMWEYSLTGAGQRVYSGRWSAGMTLPPRETVVASIPAVVPGAVPPGEGWAWSTSGNVTFLAPSRLAEVLYEIGLSRPTQTFSGSGTGAGRGGEVPSAAGDLGRQE